MLITHYHVRNIALESGIYIHLETFKFLVELVIGPVLVFGFQLGKCSSLFVYVPYCETKENKGTLLNIPLSVVTISFG